MQVAASNLRFGEGVTREVGMDFKNMRARKVYTHAVELLYIQHVLLQVAVFTDSNVVKLPPAKMVSDAVAPVAVWKIYLNIT